MRMGIEDDVLWIVSCMRLLLLLMMTVVWISKGRWWHETRLRGRIRVGGGGEIWVR